MAEWEYRSVSQDPPGPFRKVYVDRREVQTTLEETVLDLRKKGWLWVKAPDFVYFGSLQKPGTADIAELGCWDRIKEVQLKRKKEDSK